jgi:chromosome condensin MukBEF MukE localization factor
MSQTAEAGEQPFNRFDLDRQKLQEKVRSSLNRCAVWGMVWFMGHDSSKFRITESVFRFGADVRAVTIRVKRSVADPRR